MSLETDLEWFIRSAPKWPWRWAKTFEGGAEHSYVISGKQIDRHDFERAFRVVHAFGTPKKFWRRTNIELHLPDLSLPYGKVPELQTGFKFWPMSERLSVGNVINIAPIDRMYGVQDAPDTTASGERTWFDYIATSFRDATEHVDWDDWGAAVVSLVCENGAVSSLLDIGSGIGSALDLGLVVKEASAYRAVDPSQAMMNQLVFRNGWVRDLHVTTAESHLQTHDDRQFEAVVATHGAASYLEPDTVQQLAELATRKLVLMFYSDEATTDFFGETRLPASAKEARLAAESLPKAVCSMVGPYSVVSWSRS